MDTVELLQEIFNSQADFPPKVVGMLVDFNRLWEKYYPQTNKQAFSGDYYEEVDKIAEKYGVFYKVPTHIGQLKGVGSPATLH